MLKKILVYGSGPIISKALAVILIPLYTNNMTIEMFGYLSLILSFKGFLDVFVNYNVISGLSRYYYTDNDNVNKLVSTVIIFLVVTSILFVLSMIYNAGAILGFIYPAGFDHIKSLYILLVIYMPIDTIYSLTITLSRYEDNRRKTLIANFITAVGNIILVLLFYSINKLTPETVIYSMIISQSMGILFNLIVDYMYSGLIFKSILIKKTLRFSLPVVPMILMSWVDMNAIFILISKYSSIEEISYYSLALRIGSLFLLVRISLNYVWLPYVYKNEKIKSFKLWYFKYLQIIIILISYLISLIVLFGDNVIILLANDEYLQANIYLAGICTALGIYVVSSFCETGFLISKKTEYLSIITILTSIAYILSAIYLLKIYDLVTVIHALVITKYVSMYLMLMYSNINITGSYYNSNNIATLLLFIPYFLYFCYGDYVANIKYEIFMLSSMLLVLYFYVNRGKVLKIAFGH